jgi:hypothetical protein
MAWRLYLRGFSESAGCSTIPPGQQGQQVGHREGDREQRRRREPVPSGDVQDRLRDGEGEQVEPVGHVARPGQATQPSRRLVGRVDHEVGDAERDQQAVLPHPRTDHPGRERRGGEPRPQRHPLAIHVEQRRDPEDRQQDRVRMGVAPFDDPADAAPAGRRRGQREQQQPRPHDHPQPPQQQPCEAEQQDEQVGADLDRQRPQRAVHDGGPVGHEHAREPVGEVADRVARADRDQVVGDVGGGGAAAEVRPRRPCAHERAEHEGGQDDGQRERGQDAQRALERERAGARPRQPAAGDEEAADGEEDLDADDPERRPPEPRLAVPGERVGVRDEYERGGRQPQHVEAVVARVRSRSATGPGRRG